jgi:AcrR family transcriptional regulator
VVPIDEDLGEGDLEKTLGVSQYSLYNTFGSKQEVLLRAIDRYERNVRSSLLDHLQPGGGLAAVDAFLVTLTDWVIDTKLRGGVWSSASCPRLMGIRRSMPELRSTGLDSACSC